jgi:ABC-type antimicrobial peptide transport system permease subunit
MRSVIELVSRVRNIRTELSVKPGEYLPRIFVGTPDRELRYVFANGDVSESTLKAALAQFPDAKVQDRTAFKDDVNKQMDQFFALLYVLLALSVIVSLFGIVNTLVLSVFERTRELGMLRAVGMTRRQVRRMIRHESIVTSLIGGVLGLAVGLGLAAMVIGALARTSSKLVFAVPYGSLLLFGLAAIVAGMLAAIFPARRASRLRILRALQYE